MVMKMLTVVQVVDKAWHPGCVQCADCRAPLVERCFERGGRLFCRADFIRSATPSPCLASQRNTARGFRTH